MAVILVISMVFLAREAAQLTISDNVVSSGPRVVIDAGHGGNDPGKVGINGALEKEINLAIAKQLQIFLEANDVEVIMTREEDAGLYTEGERNKKVQDMKKRIEIIENEKPDIVVSIHQNSYHQESVHGAQVFYYDGSTEGEALAKIMQTQLVKGLDPDNHRQEKANDSYYLLKKTSSPIIIVECGFLSNNQESALLATEEYQEKVAWEIHLGILQYLNGKS
ncbi:MAG: N-acetylmuramoyl-L-alanine amidase [Lachnospiraceae bacterium]|nr:N-acetylmuramoyl-L-alanine amidase [Lachnospiraceae bacterium]